MNNETQESTQTTPDIEFRDPAELRLHPLFETQHELADGSNEFFDLCDDIADRGIDYPLIIDERNQILDGRHRWRAAKRLKLETVPVVVRSESDAMDIILGEILNRRHYTKGQLAYCVVPLTLFNKDSRQSEKLKNLKKGQCFPNTIESSSWNNKGLCERLGLSHDVLQQAQKLHEVFDQNEAEIQAAGGPREGIQSLREQYEPKIFDPERPMGLGAALAGIAGQAATKDRVKNSDRDPNTLFGESFKAVTFRWAKLLKNDFDEGRKAVRTMVAELPDDELESLEQLAVELKSACKARRGA